MALASGASLNETTLFRPLPGPQVAAYESEADELFYGGAAGGGKTFLGIGTALNAHRQSILFRRELPQLGEIEDRLDDLTDGLAVTNRNKRRWTLPSGRFVETGAMQREKDWRKYQGRPRDLIYFDELPHFTRQQYRAVIAWNRTSVKGQRCRVINGGNPPTTEDEAWVIEEFAPWLDKDFPDPAEPGELRYYAYGEHDQILWFHEPEAVIDGEARQLKSRTFIPARVEDNPYYMATDYVKTLDALPKELRQAMRYGEFSYGNISDPFQVIPREWVEIAEKRWMERTRPNHLSMIGLDPSRGGNDATVCAKRYENFIDTLVSVPGPKVPTGRESATVAIAQCGASDCPVVVDVIGVGASTFDHLEGHNAVSFNASRRDSDARDKSGRLSFANDRARAYWNLREMLDPEGGEDLALPPDPALRQELCTPKWKITTTGIQIEPKDDIKKRLGRSPDRADAVVMSCLTYLEAPAYIYRSLR